MNKKQLPSNPIAYADAEEKYNKGLKKFKVAGKMQSKEYKTTRCGHCGKFGHHHSNHKGEIAVKPRLHEGSIKNPFYKVK